MPGPFRAPNTRRRSCQRRRRSSHTWTSPLPAPFPVNSEPPPAIPTPAATHQHPSAPDTPAAGLSNAGGAAVTRERLPCPPRPQYAEPPPAIPTPAATHQHPSPPETPAADLANAGGGAVTRGRLPCPPPPHTRTATAGNTDTGGTTPVPRPARHARRRFFHRRRRSRNN